MSLNTIEISGERADQYMRGGDSSDYYVLRVVEKASIPNYPYARSIPSNVPFVVLKCNTSQDTPALPAVTWFNALVYMIDNNLVGKVRGFYRLANNSGWELEYLDDTYNVKIRPLMQAKSYQGYIPVSTFASPGVEHLFGDRPYARMLYYLHEGYIGDIYYANPIRARYDNVRNSLVYYISMVDAARALCRMYGSFDLRTNEFTTGDIEDAAKDIDFRKFLNKYNVNHDDSAAILRMARFFDGVDSGDSSYKKGVWKSCVRRADNLLPVAGSRSTMLEVTNASIRKANLPVFRHVPSDVKKVSPVQATKPSGISEDAVCAILGINRCQLLELNKAANGLSPFSSFDDKFYYNTADVKAYVDNLISVN